jgi:hypothetical protein
MVQLKFLLQKVKYKTPVERATNIYHRFSLLLLLVDSNVSKKTNSSKTKLMEVLLHTMLKIILDSNTSLRLTKLRFKVRKQQIRQSVQRFCLVSPSWIKLNSWTFKINRILLSLIQDKD